MVNSRDENRQRNINIYTALTYTVPLTAAIGIISLFVSLSALHGFKGAYCMVYPYYLRALPENIYYKLSSKPVNTYEVIKY